MFIYHTLIELQMEAIWSATLLLPLRSLFGFNMSLRQSQEALFGSLRLCGFTIE